MTDALRTFAVCEFAVQLDSLPLREILLLELELSGEIEQPHLAFFLGKNFVEEGQMVAEEDNSRRIVDFGVFAEKMLEEDSCHRRDVLVAEAQIGSGKTRVARLHVRHT